MTKSDEYRNYVLDHIANVRKAYDIMKVDLLKAFRCDSDLLQRNILKHDNSKFSEEEFEPYRQYFYPEDGEIPNKEKFNEAWKHHYLVNPHHPEFWVTANGPIKMSQGAIAEMFCDWAAMSMHFGNTVEKWYNAKQLRDPFNFHKETQQLIEDHLWITHLIDPQLNKKELDSFGKK